MPDDAISIKFTGVDEFDAKLKQVSKDMQGTPFARAMKASALLVSRSSKKSGYVPVDTGRLRASITPEVYSRGRDIVGVVGSNVKYAPYQEFGTRPFWPPISALNRWARRHGISAFLVARAISVRGIKALHYLQRALEDNYSRIQSIIGRAIGRIVEK